jgi:hypothetical protein
VYSSSSAYVACRPLPTAIAAERALRAAPPSGTPPSTRGCIVPRPAGRRGIVLAVAHANGGALQARLCRERAIRCAERRLPRRAAAALSSSFRRARACAREALRLACRRAVRRLLAGAHAARNGGEAPRAPRDADDRGAKGDVHVALRARTARAPRRTMWPWAIPRPRCWRARSTADMLQHSSRRLALNVDRHTPASPALRVRCAQPLLTGLSGVHDGTRPMTT